MAIIVTVLSWIPHFVKDPHTVVKAGQIVKVKVLEVDAVRKRIALTMRLTDAAAKPAADSRREPQRNLQSRPTPRQPAKTVNSSPVVPNAMSAAFSKIKV